MKRYVRLVHLWTGLIFGTILALQGLTGTLLSWRHELDRALNPGLLHVAPPAGMQDGAPLRVSPATAQAAFDRLAADARYGRPNMLMFPERAGDVFIAWYRPAPAPTWTQGVTRQVMLDPATLAVTGERNWGEPGLTRALLMPTLFHLHRYLMAGEGGKVVVAIEGVALVLAALSGVIVWWPRMAAAAIRHAFTVRYGGSWPRLSFQLHRTAGFFVAPLFVLSGFSGVQFNKPDWVAPVIRLAGPAAPAGKVLNRSAPAQPRVTPSAALERAQAQFPLARISRLTLPASAKQPYEIRVRQDGELRQGDGATRISVDAGDGSVLRVSDPLRATGAEGLVSTLFPLHTGEAFGLAGRAFISFYGLMPLAFFVTGLVVWMKFRRGKQK
ncbi:PepSY-associated TM helix domain-containing protein [Massilia agilis]